MSPPDFLPDLAAHDADALFDGAAYAEMPALLARARHTVRMAFYLFGGPDADRMMDILAAKQKGGVAVRVLLDRSLGRRNFLPGIMADGQRAYRRLRALGLPVRLSDTRPLPHWPGKPPQMHRKFLTIDDREALVGGMNVGTLFGRYHDLMLHLRGPVARSLAALFDDEWRQAGGDDAGQVVPSVTPPAGADAGAPGQAWARLLGTGTNQFPTEAALHENLLRARSSVCVALCEMGRTDLVDALVACHRRGVSVRVLLDPLVSYPWLPPAPLNAGAVDVLLRADVPVHFYRLGRDVLRLHLKMALFDGDRDDMRAVAGSTNWTRAGFGWVRETDIELVGGSVLGQMQAQFEADWRRSAPAPIPSRLALWQYAAYEHLAQ